MDICYAALVHSTLPKIECYSTDLVTLDSMLCESVVARNDLDAFYRYNVVIDGYGTMFFSNMDFILNHLKCKNDFHFLAICVEPETDCATIQLEGFDFMGYELLDKSIDVSALSNCGGFPETFSDNDLNQAGLISEYQTACNIQKNLLLNNPNEYHADTYMFAVWIHKSIGR